MESPAVSDSTPPPHLVWWALLEQRVSEAKLLLPPGLEGRIRFEVETERSCNAVLVIDVAGPKTALHIADRPGDVDVVTSDALIRRLLLEPEPPKDVFRVRGNFELFRTFFRRLSSTEQPSSWLAMQVKK